MPSLEVILFFIYLLIGPMAWVLFLVGMVHAQRMARMRRPGPALVSPAPRVAILMPAKDEGERVRVAVESALAQDYPALELIAIDDRSTDVTGAVLDELAVGEGRMRVVHLKEGDLPAGWFGKCNALHRGARGVSAQWLFFVDSDVRLEPDALRIAVAIAEDRDYDAITLMTRLECYSFWEKLLLPAAGAAISAMYRISTTNDDNRPGSAYANGQFLLIRRSVYEEAGGHEAVKDHITEDVDLLRRIKAAGHKVRLFWGRDFASTRMYDSLAGIFRGWGRIFSGSSGRRPWRILAGMAWVVFACLSVIAAVCWGGHAVGSVANPTWRQYAWLIAAGGHLALMLPLLGIVYRKSGNQPLLALLFPLTAVMLLAMYVNALRLCWTGRWIWRGTQFRKVSSSECKVRS